ncbi:MAG: sensor histidine kinase [Eubacteriales bacterium]|nr:sensor histidine kinase [Eubacteriales bacterium]
MKLSLQEKIIGSILLVSMVVSVVLSVVFYNSSVEVIENHYVSSVTDNLTVCAGMFDDNMKDAYYVAVNVASDEAVQQLAQDYDENSETELLEILNNYRDSEIDSVYCYLPQKQLLLKATKSEMVAQPCSEEDLAWLEQITAEQQNPLSPQYHTDETELLKKQSFTYTKPIPNTEGSGITADIIVNVDERDIFFGCLQGYGDFSSSSSYIETPDGRIASSTNLKQLGQAIPEMDDNVLITSVTAPLSGYQVTTVADRSVITGDIATTRNKIFLLALGFNLLAIIPILMIVRRMMRPVNNLTETMIQVGQGDLSVRAEIYSEDEIGKLSEGFNNMIQQVEDLIDALVTEKLLKKEAEIEALRYQITPHFMYNTLNSIKYAAILQNASEIAEQLEAFIELLQMSASDRGSFITVRQEIHMVQNYVKLQMFRYANSFTVSFDVMPETEGCYIPSLLLQPLVENAILHGIDLKRSDGHIVVRVCMDKHELAMKVEDNGHGMTQEELGLLMSGERRSKFSGIGVRNVRERLRLYYGEKGNLVFYSSPKQGTSAVITLPVSRDAEEYTI